MSFDLTHTDDYCGFTYDVSIITAVDLTFSVSDDILTDNYGDRYKRR